MGIFHSNNIKIFTYQAIPDNKSENWSQYPYPGKWHAYWACFSVCRFWQITFYQNKIKACTWSHYGQFVKTNRLICNLTLLGHQLTSRSRDLRSNIDIDLQGSTYTYFDASQQKKHNDVRIIALAFLNQKLFTKNYVARLGHKHWPMTSPDDLKLANRLASTSPHHGPHARFCRESLA